MKGLGKCGPAGPYRGKEIRLVLQIEKGFELAGE